jgi:hypothetical protein
MTNPILLVDLENIQKINLAAVPVHVRVRVFYGVTQKRIPTELVVHAQPLGTRLEWIKISGHGKNALDFHIAFYLGQELTASPQSDCVILSRDTGFDPLVRHLLGRGYTCRRVSSIESAFGGAQPTVEEDPFDRLLVLLKKEKARPTKPKGLSGKVRSWFPKLTDAKRLALFDRLFDESKVRLADKHLAYDL